MSNEGSDRDWGFGREFGRHFDPGNFSFARSFRRHGGMKYYVLWLLSRRQLRGSEIIEEVQKQTMGWWRPSPGTIYPLLSSLEHDGLIRRLDNLSYELTPAGAEEIGLRPGEQATGGNEPWDIERIITEMEGYASYLEEEQDNLKKFAPRIKEVINRLSKLKLE